MRYHGTRQTTGDKKTKTDKAPKRQVTFARHMPNSINYTNGTQPYEWNPTIHTNAKFHSSYGLKTILNF